MILGGLTAVNCTAADKLAVAEPVSSSKMRASDLAALWGILESSINSKEYQLISRAALKQMLTEIGLVHSSDLVNLNEKQKAQLGKLSGVKYILVSELNQLGSKINCTLRIIDASTGEIDQQRTANLRVDSIDELADRIEDTVSKLLADNKNMARSALLQPYSKAGKLPEFMSTEFSSRLEAALINGGMPLQNLQSVKNILEKNKLGALEKMEPKTYRKVGELLEVKNLIMPNISRYEVVATKYNVSESGASGTYYTGYLEGSVRVIETASGNVVGSIPFETKVEFRKIGRSITKDWTEKDYTKYMVSESLKQLTPALLKLPAFKNK